MTDTLRKNATSAGSPTRRSKCQFSLRRLFVVILVFCLLFALMAPQDLEGVTVAWFIGVWLGCLCMVMSSLPLKRWFGGGRRASQDRPTDP